MDHLKLELLLKITGIGAASGLIYKDNTLFIIGDTSGFLYEYHIDSQNLNRHGLIENPSETIVKKEKPDFEAIAHFGDSFYIFGSGSTQKRNKMIHFNSVTKKIIDTNNLSALYATIQLFSKTNPQDFNLEGAIYDGKKWYLFNRGNSKSNKNIVFTLEGNIVTDQFIFAYNPYQLPKIKGVPTSFTDAVLVNETIYFLAAAENTLSTYEDGEILGSLIGSIDLKTMKINCTQKISDYHKFEGITVYKESNQKIEFLLCEDKDNDALETTIYKLSLSKKEL